MQKKEGTTALGKCLIAYTLNNTVSVIWNSHLLYIKNKAQTKPVMDCA